MSGPTVLMIPIMCSVRLWDPIRFRTIVRDFQSVISKEARAQILEQEGKLPDAVIACVGGGSNAMGHVL